MTASEPRIVIALHPGSPAPSGHLEVAGENDRSFTGWLDLLSVLGEAVDRYAAPGADGDTPDLPRPA